MFFEKYESGKKKGSRFYTDLRSLRLTMILAFHLPQYFMHAAVTYWLYKENKRSTKLRSLFCILDSLCSQPPAKMFGFNFQLRLKTIFMRHYTFKFGVFLYVRPSCRGSRLLEARIRSSTTRMWTSHLPRTSSGTWSPTASTLSGWHVTAARVHPTGRPGWSCAPNKEVSLAMCGVACCHCVCLCVCVKCDVASSEVGQCQGCLI